MRECPECGGKFPDGTASCPSDGSTLGPEGAADPYIGKTAGSYTITRCLGRGGMGAVYQAQHPTIGSKVAVKFLHRKYAADKAIVDRFFNEARAVNVVGHDNIVKISDFSQMEDGSPYFIMEFLEGQALTDLVGPARPLAEAGPIFLQVADGLQAAHDKGIIHRDLKPDNIFLVTRNRRANFVKIVDFGIAKLQGAQGATGKTQTGMVMGTAQYMSPEQAGGEVNKISAASDVYSLGVIMYQLATGRLPFEGSNFGEILIGHLMKEPTPPRALVPQIPEAYEAIILRCLRKAPEERFTSMAELYDALGAVLDALGLPRDPPVARAIGTPAAPPVGRPESRPPLVTPPMSSPGRHGDNAPGATRVLDQKGGTQVLSSPGTGASGTMVLGAHQQPPAPPPKKGAPVGVIAAIVIVVLGGAAGAFVFMNKAPTAPDPTPIAALPAPTPPPAVVEPPAPPPAPVSRLVTVTVMSTPPGARLKLVQGDKVREGVTPATIELDRDVPASARLEADGYSALEEKFTPTNDVELRYVLAAIPKAAAKPVAVEAAARPTPGEKPEKPKAKARETVGDGMVDVDL